MKLNGIELRSDFGDPPGEAKACRQKSALFDFSFIQSARIEGERAQQVVETFSSRPMRSLQEGKILYAVHVDENGKAVSDLTIWKVAAKTFEVMSGRAEDVAALMRLNSGDVEVRDVSKEKATLAVQGPLSFQVLQQAGAPSEIRDLGYFSFRRVQLENISCVVGRLGYTGEAGFEVVAARQDLRRLWKMLAAYARPAGFIAADILRIEAGFIFFANEFRLPVTPIEAGLGKFYSGPEKSKSKLKLVTFEAEKGDIWPLPWQPAADLSCPAKANEIAVTSACRSILSGKIIGFGYVPIDTPKDVPLRDPAGVFRNISQLHTPFYDWRKLRPRCDWLKAANE